MLLCARIRPNWSDPSTTSQRHPELEKPVIGGGYSAFPWWVIRYLRYYPTVTTVLAASVEPSTEAVLFVLLSRPRRSHFPPWRAETVRNLSVIVREIAFSVSAGFWHCPGKLLKFKEMSGIKGKTQEDISPRPGSATLRPVPKSCFVGIQLSLPCHNTSFTLTRHISKCARSRSEFSPLHQPLIRCANGSPCNAVGVDFFRLGHLVWALYMPSHAQFCNCPHSALSQLGPSVRNGNSPH